MWEIEGQTDRQEILLFFKSDGRVAFDKVEVDFMAEELADVFYAVPIVKVKT